ncbi:hypothetical protein QTP88_010564 [Uroleucon formosanum]
MSSTSGGAGDKPNNPNSKLKVNLQKSKNHSEWKVVQKKNNNKSSNITPSTPISPNFQHIIDKNPQLQLPSSTQFQFNDSNMIHVINGNDNIITNPSVDRHSIAMDLDNSLNNSFDKNGSGHATVANDHSLSNINTMPNNTNFTYTSSEQSNSHGRDSNLIKFSDNFSGVPIIIIEAISDNNNANDVKESSNHDIIISDETFPNIGESRVRLKSKNYNLNFSRKKNSLIPSKQPSFPVPANKNFSFPNGTFLKYMSEITYAFPKENSWISSLVNQLTHTLINDPASFSSHSSLNNIIESHIINFFSSIQNGSQEN